MVDNRTVVQFRCAMGSHSHRGVVGLVAVASMFVACGADSDDASRGNDSIDGTDDDVLSGDGLDGDDVAEPTPAEAAFSISMGQNPSLSPGALPCAATPGRLMFPAQDDFLLVLGATTPEETVLQDVEAEVDGRDDARVSCTVHQVDDANFEVSATIFAGEMGAQFELSNVVIHDQLATSASLSWQYQLDGTYSGDCALSVDARADGTPFIALGVAKLTYSCQLANADNQACVAIGTLYLNHCAK